MEKPTEPEKSGSADPAAKPDQVKETKVDGPAPKHRQFDSRVFQLDSLEVASVSVGDHKFNLWVMDSDAKRSEGMMFLENKDFKDDEGMLFVFGVEAPRKFWMHNTLVDLDICYCDKSGKILNTYTMKSLDETTDYSSKGPSLYVIELRAGTLKKLGIKEGMKFEIPKSVASKDAGN